ncbi:MAG: hypothetical protein GF388_09465, partial [Candidatus Aegiribacteria sp.]|nr:hypothetical protein [Candidatus Aegiribacteria sp.]
MENHTQYRRFRSESLPICLCGGFVSLLAGFCGVLESLSSSKKESVEIEAFAEGVHSTDSKGLDSCSQFLASAGLHLVEERQLSIPSRNVPLSTKEKDSQVLTGRRFGRAIESGLVYIGARKVVSRTGIEFSGDSFCCTINGSGVNFSDIPMGLEELLLNVGNSKDRL